MGARQPFAIELRHLRYVIAAAEHESFRAAATALKIRPSAISRRIRDLEDGVGTSLFIRRQNGVSLTYAGQRFLDQAHEAVDRLAYATQDAAMVGRGEDGIIRIGLCASLATGFLAALFQVYCASQPGVRLEFSEIEHCNTVGAIRQRRLDIAFVLLDPTPVGCDAMPLWSERIFVGLPVGHALAARAEVGWVDLADQILVASEVHPGPAIHDFLIRHLGEVDQYPRVIFHSIFREASLLQLVAIGDQCTVVSEATTLAPFPGVTFRPLGADELIFGAVWSPTNDNPAFRRLLSLARMMNKSKSPSKTMDSGSMPRSADKRLRAAS